VVQQLANALVPVFFVMALGFYAGKKEIVDNKNLKSLIHFVMMFALPCSLFGAIAKTPKAVVLQHGSLILVLLVTYLLIYGIAFIQQRKVHGSDAAVSAVHALTVAFPNCASIGLPLLVGIFGSQSALAVAIGIAVGSMTISPITLAILESSTPAGRELPLSKRILRAIWKSVTKPVVLGPALGVIVALSGLQVPDVATRSLVLIGQATAGAALFLTGLILSAQPFKLNGNVLSGMGWKNVVQPLIAFGLVRLMGMPTTIAGEAVLLTAIPAGFFGLVFGAGYGHKPVASSSTLIASSLLGIVSLAVWIIVLQGAH
jgi:malonate transporter